MMVDASAYEVIMIVHELHQRGYEQLRLFPGISPNGMCWRWMIYPKVLMQNNSFELHGDCTPFECLRGSTGAAFPEEGQELKTSDDFIRGNEEFFWLKVRIKRMWNGLSRSWSMPRIKISP